MLAIHRQIKSITVMARADAARLSARHEAYVPQEVARRAKVRTSQSGRKLEAENITHFYVIQAEACGGQDEGAEASGGAGLSGSRICQQECRRKPTVEKTPPIKRRRLAKGVAPAVKNGTRVAVAFDDGVEYGGTVTDCCAGQIHIRYDDGEVEWAEYPDKDIVIERGGSSGGGGGPPPPLEPTAWVAELRQLMIALKFGKMVMDRCGDVVGLVSFAAGVGMCPPRAATTKRQAVLFAIAHEMWQPEHMALFLWYMRERGGLAGPGLSRETVRAAIEFVHVSNLISGEQKHKNGLQSGLISAHHGVRYVVPYWASPSPSPNTVASGTCTRGTSGQTQRSSGSCCCRLADGWPS